jgi:hypothetical protein
MRERCSRGSDATSCRRNIRVGTILPFTISLPAMIATSAALYGKIVERAEPCEVNRSSVAVAPTSTPATLSSAIQRPCGLRYSILR